MKKLSKVLAVFLVSAMVLSMSACSSEEDNFASTNESSSIESSNKSSKADSESSSINSEESSEALSESSEPTEDNSQVTITWGFRDTNVKESGNLTEKSEAWAAVADKLGISVELVTFDIEKYNLLAAGGDFPDIISLINTGTPVTDIVASGQLIKLDDLLASGGENLENNIGKAIERVNAPFDGIYVLPVGVEGQSTVPSKQGYFGAFYGRYDVYKAIGSPEIDGLDGLLEVAKQMQEEERERTGRDDIYAFSNYFSNSYGCTLGTFMMGTEGLSNAEEFDLRTYEIRNMYLDENSTTWAYYEFLNKAYRMGILDPDSIIMDGSEYGTKLENGSTLFNMEWDYDVNDDAKVPEYVEYGDFYPLPGSLDFMPFLYGRLLPDGYGFDSARAITTNCEYPERAMQLLNWLDGQEGARMLFSGAEGDSWNYTDGVPVFSDAVYTARSDGTWSEYWEQHRLLGYGSNMMCSGRGAIKTDDGYPADLSQSEDYLVATAEPAGKAYAEDFGCKYPGQVFAKWISEGTMSTDTYTEEYEIATTNAHNILLSNEYSEIYTSITDYLAANVNTLILADSEEAFNTAKADIIQGMIDLGAQDLDNEVNRQLDEMDWGSYSRK